MVVVDPMYIEPGSAFPRKGLKNVKKTDPGSWQAQKKDTSYSFKPLNTFLWMFGMQKITYCNNSIRRLEPCHKFYSCVWIVGTMINGGLVAWVMFNPELPGILQILEITTVTASVLAFMTAVFKGGISNSDGFVVMMKNMDSVDKKLGATKGDGYESARRRVLTMFIPFAVLNMSNLLTDEIIASNAEMRVFVLLRHILTTLTNVHLFDFTTVLWLNVLRVRRANAKLSETIDTFSNVDNDGPMESFFNDFKNIKVIGVEEAREFKEVNMSTKRSEKILFVLKIFDVLADNVQIMNECYGLPLLLSSATTFVSILGTINGLIMEHQMLGDIKFLNKIIIIMWSAPVTIFTLIAAYVSETLKDEMEKTSLNVDKLTINPATDSDQLQLLECFSQLLVGRNMFISAFNFFPFDFSFVFSLVGTIATYTVILMQVNESPTMNFSSNSFSPMSNVSKTN